MRHRDPLAIQFWYFFGFQVSWNQIRKAFCPTIQCQSHTRVSQPPTRKFITKKSFYSFFRKKLFLVASKTASLCSHCLWCAGPFAEWVSLALYDSTLFAEHCLAKLVFRGREQRRNVSHFWTAVEFRQSRLGNFYLPTSHRSLARTGGEFVSMRTNDCAHFWLKLISSCFFIQTFFARIIAYSAQLGV